MLSILNENITRVTVCVQGLRSPLLSPTASPRLGRMVDISPPPVPPRKVSPVPSPPSTPAVPHRWV